MASLCALEIEFIFRLSVKEKNINFLNFSAKTITIFCNDASESARYFVQFCPPLKKLCPKNPRYPYPVEGQKKMRSDKTQQTLPIPHMR